MMLLPATPGGKLPCTMARHARMSSSQPAPCNLHCARPYHEIRFRRGPGAPQHDSPRAADWPDDGRGMRGNRLVNAVECRRRSFPERDDETLQEYDWHL